RASFLDALNSITLVLNNYPDTRLNIVGHTDSTGSDAYNLELSKKRALAVAQYLISQNVATFRVNAMGAGEKQPIASNNTNSGRALNRRVELSISPSTS
ncbi:MAG: OmpA family protein, partial [Gammaproteobacteria bacterium]|nr:OmpA family protein [Gammaproteobacteria bacterium]